MLEQDEMAIEQIMDWISTSFKPYRDQTEDLKRQIETSL